MKETKLAGKPGKWHLTSTRQKAMDTTEPPGTKHWRSHNRPAGQSQKPPGAK